MQYRELTIENFDKAGLVAYRQPFVDDDTFYEDLKLITTLTKRLEKFSRRGQINLRLVFNNFIVANNCFDRMFIFKSLFILSKKEYHNDIFTFIRFFTGFEGPLYINEDLIIDFSPIHFNLAFKNMIEKELQKWVLREH